MGGYICYLKRTRIRYYRIEEVDFFAIYVLEKKTWFILPARVVLRLKSNIRVAPGMKEQKYARYEEVMESRVRNRQDEIHVQLLHDIKKNSHFSQSRREVGHPLYWFHSGWRFQFPVFRLVDHFANRDDPIVKCLAHLSGPATVVLKRHGTAAAPSHRGDAGSARCGKELAAGIVQVRQE
jgi:hypothetical protein